MTAYQRLSLFASGMRALHNRLRRGAAAIEFALVAPAFFLIFIGVVEMSLAMLAQHLLENATFNASRLAKTGYIATGRTQIQTVMDVLDTELGSLAPLIDVAKISFTSTAFGQLDRIGLPGQGADGLGAADQIVVYTISYPWKIFTPMISNIIGDANGIITLTSHIVVRNEPYS